MVTNNFALTLQQTCMGYQDTEIRVVQNDASVNILTIEVYNAGVEITYSGISSGTITFVKDDGNVVQGDLTINASNITYAMGTNEIAVPGVVRASVQLFGASGERLTPAKFRFYVESDLVSASAIQSTTEFPILQALKIELEAIDVVELTNDFNAHLAETAAHTELLNKTIYVSPAGNDTTGDGSVGLPYRTITYALSTIKKHSETTIKIRILQGDYIAEEQILVNNSAGGALYITAFDGTNDVTAVSDLYKIDCIAIGNSKTVYVQGIKSIPSSESYSYAFYAGGSTVRYIGCSFDKAGNVNSGFGCTEHSYIVIDSCMVANSLNVISANYGAEVVVKNWDSGSTGNTNVFRVENGAEVLEYDSTRPVYTGALFENISTGRIYNSNGIQFGITRSQQVIVSKDITIAENLVIPINFNDPPSWINIGACINTTKIWSHGNWSLIGNSSSSNKSDTNGTMAGSNDLIDLDFGGGNSIHFNVSSVTASAITLSRSVYGAVSGTMLLTVLCGI